MVDEPFEKVSVSESGAPTNDKPQLENTLGFSLKAFLDRIQRAGVVLTLSSPASVSKADEATDVPDDDAIAEGRTLCVPMWVKMAVSQAITFKVPNVNHEMITQRRPWKTTLVPGNVIAIRLHYGGNTFLEGTGPGVVKTTAVSPSFNDEQSFFLVVHGGRPDTFAFWNVVHRRFLYVYEDFELSRSKVTQKTDVPRVDEVFKAEKSLIKDFVKLSNSMTAFDAEIYQIAGLDF